MQNQRRLSELHHELSDLSTALHVIDKIYGDNPTEHSKSVQHKLKDEMHKKNQIYEFLIDYDIKQKQQQNFYY